MSEDEKYMEAKRRVDAKIGLCIHLVVYIGVNLLLLFINLYTSTSYLWFKWPLFGWGFGIAFHALAVYAFSEGSPVKRRMIEKEMQKGR